MLDNVYIKINVNGQTFKGSGPSYSVAISSPTRQSIAIRPVSAINLKFATRPSPSFGALVGDPTDNDDLVEYITEQIAAGREKRVVTIATSTTPTANCDTTDQYNITALAGNATFGAPTGTPHDGQKLRIRVTADASDRVIDFNEVFRFTRDQTIPTITAEATVYFDFIYNSVDEVWDCLNISSYYGGASPVLFLDAALGKTGDPLTAWADQSGNNNNATSAHGPSDQGTYLEFDGIDQRMNVADNSQLNPLDKISIEAKFLTTSGTNFIGVLDKYDAALSKGYALFLNSNKLATQISLSKGNVNISSTTSVNDGVEKTVLVTTECTRKFTNQRSICLGEEPEVQKIGDNYVMVYGRTDGTNNIYLRSSASPYFEDSVETLLLTGYRYPALNLDNGNYRLLVCSEDLSSIILFTSETLSDFIEQGEVLAISGLETGMADPHNRVINGVYFIYYSSFVGASDATIAYATSATGLPGSFTKQGTCIAKGSAGSFDENLTADADLEELSDGSLVMTYTGLNNALSKQQQGFAYSTDGITWTKDVRNPIFFFTGQSFQSGIYGPNEPSLVIDGNKVRFYYRCNNVSEEQFAIGYAEFSVSGSTINAGGETITTKVYVDNNLETTEVLTGVSGIDYMVPSSQDLILAGDGASTSYFPGKIYLYKIFDRIITSV